MPNGFKLFRYVIKNKLQKHNGRKKSKISVIKRSDAISINPRQGYIIHRVSLINLQYYLAVNLPLLCRYSNTESF